MILPVFITVIPGHDKPQLPGCLLDKELEEGDWSGWSVSVHSPWGNEKVSAARTVLENGLRGGLPEPSRPAAVSFARLEPASGNEQKIIRLMVTQQLEQVTDIPASQLPAAGNNVPVKYRLTDLMQNGTQYMAIIGGIPMTVPVVDAVPVPDRSRPGTNIKDVYSAPVSPNLPDLVLSAKWHLNRSQFGPLCQHSCRLNFLRR